MTETSDLTRSSYSDLTLTVVICCYTLDRWDDLDRCVRSVLAQQPLVAETLLVVDHNDELLAAAVRAVADGAWAAVRVLANTERQGLSGARNTGTAAAAGDIVAFLDDDATARPGWASATVAAYADPTVAGTAGIVLPDWRVPRPRWFPDEFLWVVGCTYRGFPGTTGTHVRNAIGASMSFRRSSLEAVHGFDADLGRFGADAAGCEETELSVRVARATNGKVIVTSQAQVLHAVTSNRATRTYFRRRCSAEGRSKAMVGRLVGTEAALSAERAYSTRVLPAGVARGVFEALSGDLGGLLRAAAIIEGLLRTAAGYAAGRVRPTG